MAVTALLLSCLVRGVTGAWTLELAASTQTPIPGKTGNFLGFGASGLAADKSIVYLGHGSGSYNGLFTQTIFPVGIPVLLADTTTPIPDFKNASNAVFDYFLLGSSLSSVDARLTVFVGGAYDAGLSAIYFPGLKTVVTSSTPVPGRPQAKFQRFLSPSHGDDEDIDSPVSFIGDFVEGSNPEEYGVYTASPGGPLQLLADFSTVIPGSGGRKFTMVTGAILEHRRTVFFGSARSTPSDPCTGHLDLGPNDPFDKYNCSSRTGTDAGPWPGIYMHDGVQLTALVDTSMAPPGEGTFTGFSDPSFDGDVVCFVAACNGGTRGIWTYSIPDKSITTVATYKTYVPGTSTNFGAFPQIPAVDFGVVVFYADVSLNTKYTGVYDATKTGSSYTLGKIVTKGDVVQGHTVNFLQSSRDGYNGNQVALFASTSKSGKQVDGIIVGSWS